MSDFDNSLEQIASAPFVVADTRDGYDFEGNYHINTANLISEPSIHIPYRIAEEIQEHVTREAVRIPYLLGSADREDIAHDYALKLIDQNAVDPSTLAFDALIVWRRRYGR